MRPVERIRRGGFTLVEILVSVAVLGVAVSLFLSLFFSSLGLSQSSRSQCVASSLAEEQLLSVTRAPERFVWALGNVTPGQLVEIKPSESPESDAGHFAPPSSMPSVPAVDARERAYYDKFTWQMFAKVPEPGTPQVEVTVVVRWTEAGRDQVLALTSTVHRSKVPFQAKGGAV